MPNSYEERKQLKEEEKEKARRALSQQTLYERFLKFFILIVALALVGYGIYSLIKKNIPEEDFSKEIPLLGAEHIAINAPHEVYNSNPPTSGSHYADPAKPGFREETIADGHLLHRMEHGLICVS